MNENNNGFNSWNNNSYSENTQYGNYAYNSMDRAEIESKLITRSFILMFAALLVTTASAVIVANDLEKMFMVYQNFTILLIAEVVIVLGASFAIAKKKTALAGVLFTGYAIINGMTLSYIFFAYDLGSVQSIFLMTAVLFAVMAVIGAVTKVNLSSVGGICLMLLIGMIIVTLFNTLLFHSQGIEMVMNYLGVVIFVGLTAYDVQRLKHSANYINESNINSEAIFWGMELYLDFINLFLKLLALFGKRK